MRFKLALSMMHSQGRPVPSVLLDVFESTRNPPTVTAEVASSSLVVPAFFRFSRQV